MMKWLGPLGANVVLLYSVKGPEIPYLAELVDMKNQFPGFTVWVNITREEPLDLPTSCAFQFQYGRITESQIRAAVPDLTSRALYVLGPAIFMQTMKDLVLKLAHEHFQHFLQTAKTGPDNERPEEAHKCWQDAYKSKE